MSTECELTELPPEMCSHCKGLDRRRAWASAEPGPRVIARFSGLCPVCESWFAAGEAIVLVDDAGWAHEECAS